MGVRLISFLTFGGETHSLHLEHRILGALAILNIAVFKGKKIDKFAPDRRNITIGAFYKTISKTFSPNIRTENMVSFHP